VQGVVSQVVQGVLSLRGLADHLPQPFLRNGGWHECLLCMVHWQALFEGSFWGLGLP